MGISVETIFLNSWEANDRVPFPKEEGTADYADYADFLGDGSSGNLLEPIIPREIRTEENEGNEGSGKQLCVVLLVSFHAKLRPAKDRTFGE